MSATVAVFDALCQSGFVQEVKYKMNSAQMCLCIGLFYLTAKKACVLCMRVIKASKQGDTFTRRRRDGSVGRAVGLVTKSLGEDLKP